MENLTVIILAAGKGKRMNSSRQKVLHTLLGEAMICHIVRTVRKLNPDKVLVVVGHQKEAVMHELRHNGVLFVEQTEPLGTGDAVKRTAEELRGCRGNVLVMCGDTPLLTVSTLENLIRLHRRERAAASVLTAVMDRPFGYGRIKRNGCGEVESIVEEGDASEEERGIHEINAGVYFFSVPELFASLAEITPNNVKGEYYLTDVIRVFRSRGERVVAWLTDRPGEIRGVNTPEELEAAKEFLAGLRKERVADE